MFVFLDSKVKTKDFGLMLAGILWIYLGVILPVHFDMLVLFPNILPLPYYFERIS